jgi:hypothetical protein
MALDYAKFAFLENYLLDIVGPRFRTTGELSPIDFYMMVVWKSNRAKTRVRDRLIARGGTFNNAVELISVQIRPNVSPKERLKGLMVDWGLRLPMASAILTILYPEDFTVYDIRVCEALPEFSNLSNLKFGDKLWTRYQNFVEAVHAAVPDDRSLRGKDHYLWGHSFYKGVQKDLGITE